MKVYFAHSMLIYGTGESLRAVRYIKKLIPGCRILNPEDLTWSELESRYGKAGAFWAVVKACDAVVVLEHKGHIGRGVYCEARAAMRQKKPLFVLRKLHLIPVKSVKIKNPNWTAFDYAKVKTKSPDPV